MNWELLTEEKFRESLDRCGGLCVLPIGCLEGHGQHGPLGTDSIIAKTTVEMAAEMEEVMVFPTGMWLGDLCCAHAWDDPVGFKHCGYIGLNPHTLLTVLEELCDEIARNGFRKVLIANAHGGNAAMLKYFLRSQGYHKKNYATMLVDCYDKATDEDIYPYFLEHRDEYPMLTEEDMETLKRFHDMGGYGGAHAHLSETAQVMDPYPESVNVKRSEEVNGDSLHHTDYLGLMGVSVTNAWTRDFPNSYSAYPSTGCTQTIGAAMNLYCARRLAGIFKALKNDEKCVEIAMYPDSVKE